MATNHKAEQIALWRYRIVCYVLVSSLLFGLALKGLIDSNFDLEQSFWPAPLMSLSLIVVIVGACWLNDQKDDEVRKAKILDSL